MIHKSYKSDKKENKGQKVTYCPPNGGQWVTYCPYGQKVTYYPSNGGNKGWIFYLSVDKIFLNAPKN